nr:hypothetical protein CFP56_09246 [Quercus suber]
MPHCLTACTELASSLPEWSLWHRHQPNLTRQMTAQWPETAGTNDSHPNTVICRLGREGASKHASVCHQACTFAGLPKKRRAVSLRGWLTRKGGDATEPVL